VYHAYLLWCGWLPPWVCSFLCSWGDGESLETLWWNKDDSFLNLWLYVLVVSLDLVWSRPHNSFGTRKGTTLR
jgi:hypothetical protein